MCIGSKYIINKLILLHFQKKQKKYPYMYTYIIYYESLYYYYKWIIIHGISCITVEDVFPVIKNVVTYHGDRDHLLKHISTNCANIGRESASREQGFIRSTYASYGSKKCGTKLPIDANKNNNNNKKFGW